MQTGSTSLTCKFCLDYCCLQCNKHVFYGQKGVLYSGFDKWIHQKYAGLSSLESTALQNDSSNELGFADAVRKICIPSMI